MRLTIVILLFSFLHVRAQTTSSTWLPAKTIGKLPMLAAGQGTDRLGGAKLGYIDTGVLVNIIDSVKEMYLLRLSQQHTAYIDKQFVTIDTSVHRRPFYLTNSWSVKGNKDYDVVAINVDEKLPYKSWMELNPSRIMVELYGVQSNTNWISQLKSATEIKEVDVAQQEDDVVRITISLTHQQHWGYSISYTGNNLLIRVRRQPQIIKFKKMKIAVDAGHGGGNTGATGSMATTFEKDYTLRFAEELQTLLAGKGSKVIMTRTSDVELLNSDRILYLQKEMPDLLVSLHLNSSDNKEVKGVSTYYKHVGFKSLTTSILDRLLELNLNEFGNIGNFNFALSAPTDFPGTLVEIAFISNAEDEKKIMDPRFQKAVAKKIYRGIKDWIKSIKD